MENCVVMDSQLNAILPALSWCFQLIMLSFCENFFSMSILKDLLYHTARLS